MTVASLGLAPFETWSWPSPLAVLMLFCASFALPGGNFWIVVSMGSGDIATVAPFRYSIILWAVAAGFVMWGEMPDPATWVGIAIVFFLAPRVRRIAKYTVPDLLETLRAKGYPAYLENPAAGAPPIYRVRVGRYKDRAEAERVARRLQKEEQFSSDIRR